MRNSENTRDVMTIPHTQLRHLFLKRLKLLARQRRHAAFARNACLAREIAHYVYLPPIFSCSRGELRLPTPTQPLTLACRSRLRIKVLSNVVFEDLLQPLNDWRFPAPDLSAGYFAHGQEISIRGRNKNLV